MINNCGIIKRPDADGRVFSDNSLAWMIRQTETAGLTIEPYLKVHVKPVPLAKIHISRRSFYRVRKKYFRPIDHGCVEVILHESVTQHWHADETYRPENLMKYGVRPR